MRRYRDKALDTAELVFGAPLFVVVAALTALVMAIGFPIVETYERLRNRD